MTKRTSSLRASFVLSAALVLLAGCAQGISKNVDPSDDRGDGSAPPTPDASVSDASMTDSGSSDAGSPDGGSTDAGSDAGTDGGTPPPPVDAGNDTAPTPTCTDQTRNGNETDVDCGGSCPKCGTGAMCGVPADCTSGLCPSGLCVEPSSCTWAVDCGSGVCSNGTCAACVDTTNCKCATRNGVTYRFCRESRSFAAASSECEALGLRLARIDAAEENQWVRDRYKDSTVDLNDPWIGARDAVTPGEWTWADGTLFWTGGNTGSVVQGQYANWNSGHPENGRCGSFSGWDNQRLWESRNCSDTRHFVCKAY